MYTFSDTNGITNPIQQPLNSDGGYKNRKTCKLLRPQNMSISMIIAKITFMFYCIVKLFNDPENYKICINQFNKRFSYDI